MKRVAVIALLASASALGLAACSNEPAAKLVGTQVDNFLLVDQTGMAHSLKYDTQTPAVVLVSNVVGDDGARAAAKAAQALATSYFQALEMIKNDPQKAFQIMGADVKQSAQAFEASQKYLRWQDKAANRKFFAGELQQFSKEAGALLMEIGIIKSMPDIDSIYDTRFIK